MAGEDLTDDEVRVRDEIAIDIESLACAHRGAAFLTGHDLSMVLAISTVFACHLLEARGAVEELRSELLG